MIDVLLTSMGKIGVIIAHEYTTRVKSKWFIIATLLGPVGMLALILIPALVMILAGESPRGKVAVIDRYSPIGAAVYASDTARFTLAGDLSEEVLKERVLSEELEAYVLVPQDLLQGGALQLFSRGGTGLTFNEEIATAFQPVVVRARLAQMGADTSVIGVVEQEVDIAALKLNDQGTTEQDASEASAAIGYGSGFAIYFLIFIYGTMVMRGVVEEKANRIVEVMASSVQPFQLMMGKVVGIGLVGLTQVTLWIVLVTGSMLAIAPFLSSAVDGATAMNPEQLQAMQQGVGGSSAMAVGGFAVPSISAGPILLAVFMFLAGYFMYATLFAAVGSAVDQEADAQSLTLPITLPVVLTMTFIGYVVSAPNAPLSVALSLIPLFSPILMTVRIAATDVPWWQVGLSMFLLVAAFLGAVWMASRIYRIGILSYGKKPTFKEIARWLRTG